mgnify:FL=1
MKINQEIKNPYCEVKESNHLNDRDYLYSVLILEEKLADDYSRLLNEASHEYLYEDYFILFEDTKDAYREIKNQLFQKGWINHEVAPEKEVQKLSLIATEIVENLNLEE